MDRWTEFRANQLTPPVVVQHDQIGQEHLFWVWTGEGIIGPLSRPTADYDEAVATATALAEAPVVVDTDPWQAEKARLEEALAAKDAALVEKEEEIARVAAEKADVESELAKKTEELEAVKSGKVGVEEKP